MQATPVKTAWTGYYVQEGKNQMNFDNIIFGEAGELRGDGGDDIGQFILSGSYGRSMVKFTKQYIGAHSIAYEGSFKETAEGQAIKGHWGFKFGEPEDEFELLRGKELEKKREAAFKAEVSRVKIWAGASRLLFEDIGFIIIKVLYLFEQAKSSSQVFITCLTLAASFGMTAAGPYLESRTAAKMQQLACDVKAPVICDGERAKDLDDSDAKKAGDGAKKAGDGGMTDPLLGSEDLEYQAHLKSAKEITTVELFTGNLDYIALMMEHTHQPAEVIDVAITDVIVSHPEVRYALCLSTGIFWLFLIVSPFLFEVTCDGGLPSGAMLGFFVTAFLNIFVQLWCAALTKYGYLMLAHAPQMFAFDMGLSFMGLFSSFSSVQWVMMVRGCGSWLWKPGFAIFVLGMILLQALPGLWYLKNATNIPWGLRLTMNNLLLALLKPVP